MGECETPTAKATGLPLCGVFYGRPRQRMLEQAHPVLGERRMRHLFRRPVPSTPPTFPPSVQGQCVEVLHGLLRPCASLQHLRSARPRPPLAILRRMPTRRATEPIASASCASHVEHQRSDECLHWCAFFYYVLDNARHPGETPPHPSPVSCNAPPTRA